ncbi:hypothetical protein NLJ89_g843 [Agrocybe chaxingu]|uniref:Uncharacterized protein n=1 Tax=Agrocybe chaxingu TaxID=84603 RepID=A0A9W8N155_9AGAR|nr:hypothetical protein NLJ89_g843 [Agrocybe chaxingu]
MQPTKSTTCPDLRRPAPAFPLDIIELIVNELADDAISYDIRRARMQICAEVSRSFRYQARRNLFSELELIAPVDTYEYLPLRRLRELFDSHMKLQEYVKKVTLIIQLPSTTHKPPAYEVNVPIILEKLHRLSAFGIRTRCAGVGSEFIPAFDWYRCSDDWRSAFWSLHQHPTLQTLEIGQSFIVHASYLVEQWASLKTLKLDPGCVFEDEADVLAPNQDVGQPESLELACLGLIESLDWMTKEQLKVFTARVKRFYFHGVVPYYSFDTLMSFIETCVVLEDLRIMRTAGMFRQQGINANVTLDASVKGPIRLPPLPNLRTVEVIEPSLFLDGRTSIQEAHYMFPILSPDSVVESLILQVGLNFLHGVQSALFPEHEILDPTNLQWREFDHSLSRLQHLKRVEIRLQFWYHYALGIEEREAIRRVARERTAERLFPLVSDKKAAVVRVEVEMKERYPPDPTRDVQGYYDVMSKCFRLGWHSDQAGREEADGKNLARQAELIWRLRNERL